MRTPAILLAAAVIALVPSGASAFPDSPPSPVTVGTGGCPAGYGSAFNVNTTHVCVRSLSPDVIVTDSGCPSGYVEAGSAIVDQWVCVRI